MSRHLADFWQDSGGPARDRLGRWRRGVTVVLHPRTARIGALVRAGDLHKGTLLDAITRSEDSGRDDHRSDWPA